MKEFLAGQPVIKTSWDYWTGWTVQFGDDGPKASTAYLDASIGQLVMRHPELFGVRLDRKTKNRVRADIAEEKRLEEWVRNKK